MVLSLIPFLLVALSVFGFIAYGINTEFSNRLLQFVRTNQPLLTEPVQRCIEFATKNRDILGIIGILSLLWTSKGVVFSLEYCLDKIFATATRKSYFRKLLDSIFMLFIVVFLFAFSMD